MIKGKSLLTGEPLTGNHLVIRRRFEGYEQSFDLYRCPTSGLVQTVPMPDMQELQLKEYHDGYVAYQSIDLKKTRISANRKLRRIECHLDKNGSKRILDVGCSTGWFLKACQDRGYEVAGVEFSPYAAKKANDLLGDGVVTGTFHDLEYLPKSFDVVHSNQVIEHVPDPIPFVKNQIKYLKRNGLLVIGTPNMDSLAWKRLRGNWASLQKPDHIVMFCPTSLLYLLEQESFEVLAIHSTGMPPLGGEPKPEVDQNVNRINSSPMRKRSSLGKLKHWVLGQPTISNLAADVIDRFGLGDTIYVIARKR